MKVGVARETAAGERRVALVPEALAKITAAGLDVLVEAGAGSEAAIPDSAYADAGATIVPTAELYAQADVILRVQKPLRRRGRPAPLRTGRRRLPRPADRPEAGRHAGRQGRHGDQPRRPPPDPVASAVDGRAQLAGQRRRLQGRPHRGERLRPVLPVADDRGRDRQAGERPDPRDRRGRPPGHRHRAPAGRRRQGLRRPVRDEGAGRVARGDVHRPQVGRRRVRRGRLRPPADARRAGRPAGRAERPHRHDGRGHHDGPGARVDGRRCSSPPPRSPG